MYLLSYCSPELVPANCNFHYCSDRLHRRLPEVLDADEVFFSVSEEGYSLWLRWFQTSERVDKVLTGVLCDWLQDHRDLLLSGAVGPNPAERLEQVIEWFRQHFERGSYAKTN